MQILIDSSGERPEILANSPVRLALVLDPTLTSGAPKGIRRY